MARRGNMRFNRIVAGGENPKGFTAQTANGTAKSGNNPGWNQEYEFEHWPAEERGPWKNGNRSGE